MTITWTKTNERSVAAAGASPTIAEWLVALNAMFTTDSAQWDVSAYSAVNGTLEVKRRVSGSPAGEYATVRFLFFGGALPVAAAMTTPAPALGTTTLYFAGSVDANTTGPGTSYTAGAPYSTKYMKGSIVNLASAFTAVANPKVCMIESTEGFMVLLHDANGAAMVGAGYLVTDQLNSIYHWGIWNSGNAPYTNLTQDSAGASTTAHPMPVFYNSTAGLHGRYWNSISANCRAFGRSNAWAVGSTAGVAGASGNAITLMPISLVDATIGTTTTPAFFGYLRQIRLGPVAQNLQTITVSGVQQAICIGQPVGASGYGVWADQSD